MTIAAVMQSMPTTGHRLGPSSGSSSQLSSAPQTGIRNFHRLSSETRTPGLRSKTNQMEKAAAERKASQPSAA